MKEKWNLGMAVVLMVAFALTRWPGMMPQNFSAAYAIAFCAGVYFPGRVAWWLPLTVLAATDLALDCYYYFSVGVDSFQIYQLVNYAAYAGIIGLGRRFSFRSSFVALLGGGLLGAFVFYLLTNTAAWLFNPFGNPEYTKDLAGWIIALTKGTAGWPATWEFFRNTLLSGGLFTGLFVGAMKMSEAAESPEAEADEAEAEPEPAETENSKP